MEPVVVDGELNPDRAFGGVVEGNVGSVDAEFVFVAGTDAELRRIFESNHSRAFLVRHGSQGFITDILHQN